MKNRFQSAISKIKAFGMNDWVFFLIVASSFVSYLAMIIVLTLIPVYAVVSGQYKKLRPRYGYFRFFLVFAVFAFFSTWFFASDVHFLSFNVSSDYLRLLAFGIVLLSADLFFFSNIATRKNIFASLKLALYFSVTSFIVGIYQWCFDLYVSPDRPGRFASVYFNENYYGTVLEFLIILSIYFIIRYRGKKKALPFVFLLIINISSLWLCQSRMAFVSVAAAALVLLFFADRKFFYGLLSLFAVFAVLLFIFPNILPRFDTVPEYLEYRISIWKTAIEAFRDNFLFGRGYLTYSGIWQDYNGGTTAAAHAHSIFLETLLSFGIAGSAALAVFTVSAVKRTLKTCLAKKEKSDLALVIATVTVILLHGLMDAALFWPQGLMYAVFMLLFPQIYEETEKENICQK